MLIALKKNRCSCPSWGIYANCFSSPLEIFMANMFRFQSPCSSINSMLIFIGWGLMSAVWIMGSTLTQEVIF